MTYAYLAPTQTEWNRIVEEEIKKGNYWASSSTDLHEELFEEYGAASVLITNNGYITYAYKEWTEIEYANRPDVTLTWLNPSLMHPTLLGKSKPQTP